MCGVENLQPCDYLITLVFHGPLPRNSSAKPFRQMCFKNDTAQHAKKTNGITVLETNRQSFVCESWMVVSLPRRFVFRRSSAILPRISECLFSHSVQSNLLNPLSNPCNTAIWAPAKLHICWLYWKCYSCKCYSCEYCADMCQPMHGCISFLFITSPNKLFRQTLPRSLPPNSSATLFREDVSKNAVCYVLSLHRGFLTLHKWV